MPSNDKRSTERLPRPVSRPRKMPASPAALVVRQKVVLHCQPDRVQPHQLRVHHLPWPGPLLQLRVLWRTRLVQFQPNGRVLRVAYRVNSGGWLGSYHPVGYKNQVPMVRDDRWYGMLPKLVDEFAKSSGAIINMTEAPLWVLDVANFSSDFTNCAHAVSLGMLDFCTGMFTITTERAIMTNFHTIETTPLYLVVRQEEKATLWDRIFRAFKPFTFGAWTCVLAVLLSSSFILFCQETLPGGKHFRRDALMRGNALSRMASSAYFGLQGFFSGDVGRDYSTWEGRGTAIGIGFFVMIILSMYTANLTTILVAEASKTSLSGIDDAIHQKVPICIRDSALKLVKNLYPKADWKMIGGKIELIEAIASGECRAGISYLEDLEVLQSRGEFCALTHVGLPVVNAYRGIPLNPLKTKVLTYHFQKIINEGAWNNLKQNGLQNQCRSTSGSDDKDSLQFDVTDLIGISVICVVITAIFGTLSAMRWRTLSLKRASMITDGKTQQQQRPPQFMHQTGAEESAPVQPPGMPQQYTQKLGMGQGRIMQQQDMDQTNKGGDIVVVPIVDESARDHTNSEEDIVIDPIIDQSAKTFQNC